MINVQGVKPCIFGCGEEVMRKRFLHVYDNSLKKKKWDGIKTVFILETVFMTSFKCIHTNWVRLG